MRWSLPTWVSLWATSHPASTADQVQGRHLQGVEHIVQACSVEGGVHEGTPLITVKKMSLLAGIFMSMKYACPCLHSGEFITATGSSIIFELASAQFNKVLTWEYVILMVGKPKDRSLKRRWMDLHKFLVRTDLWMVEGFITHK